MNLIIIPLRSSFHSFSFRFTHIHIHREHCHSWFSKRITPNHILFAPRSFQEDRIVFVKICVPLPYPSSTTRRRTVLEDYPLPDFFFLVFNSSLPFHPFFLFSPSIFLSSRKITHHANSYSTFPRTTYYSCYDIFLGT